MRHLESLEDRLSRVPGTVSVWCGRRGQPAAYSRHVEVTHYAASTIKVAVLAALHHDIADLDRDVLVHNEFESVVGGRYGLVQRHDQDDAVWARIGTVASLRWLAERMIICSSNLATNLIVEQVGLDGVAFAYDRAGARRSMVTRCIGDTAAAAAGLTNLITAEDLAAVMTAATGDEAMCAVLLRQQRREDVAAGLPAGTRVAHKNGWVMGVRHAAGVIFPPDSPPLTLVVCATTPWAVNDPDDEACALVRDIARAAWMDRHNAG